MNTTKTTGDQEWLQKAYTQAQQNADELKRMYLAATRKNPNAFAWSWEKCVKALQSMYQNAG